MSRPPLLTEAPFLPPLYRSEGFAEDLPCWNEAASLHAPCAQRPALARPAAVALLYAAPLIGALASAATAWA